MLVEVQVVDPYRYQEAAHLLVCQRVNVVNSTWSKIKLVKHSNPRAGHSRPGVVLTMERYVIPVMPVGSSSFSSINFLFTWATDEMKNIMVFIPA